MNANYYSIYKDQDLDQLAMSLHVACKKGEIEKVKYILISPDLKQKPILSQYDYQPFLQASTYGHIEIVEYLLKMVKDDKEKLTNYVLHSACKGNQVNLVRFLLNSDTVECKPDIHKQNDFLFTNVIVYSSSEIQRYFVIEANLQKTEAIQEHLERYPNPELEKLFAARDFNQQLNLELANPKIETKKLKI